MSALPVIYARLERWPATSIALADQSGVLTPVGIAPEYGALGREFLARISEGKITHISENHTRHTERLARLQKRLEDCPPTSESPTVDGQHAARLLIEDRMMNLGRPGEWGQRHF